MSKYSKYIAIVWIYIDFTWWEEIT